MRALTVLHYPVFGGPHNQAAQLAPALERRGWETLVILPTEPGNAEARLRGEGVGVRTMPLHRMRATMQPFTHIRLATRIGADISGIRQLIRTERIDLVQVSGLINPQAAIAGWLEGRPVVWQLLDTRAPVAARFAMIPVIRALADVVMTTGLKVASQHPGLGTVGERLIPYVPPVDTVAFRPGPERRAAARERLRVPEDGILVGTLANLNPQKGHEYLLQAVAKLRSTCCRDVYLRILGAATPTHRQYEARLVAEAGKLGLSDNTHFSIVDPHGDANLLLTAFDIFALTSARRSEGIPTVLLEAMACGLPVVVTDVGGVTDVVGHAATGLVVPPSSVTAITDALERLVHDPTLRAGLGTAGRRKAETDFHLEDCADAHADAYSRAIRHYRSRDPI
jgi:glycosyltransferase involved in cell wall biosynthesis